jgi:DNA-binding transcriptional MerR regulator
METTDISNEEMMLVPRVAELLGVSPGTVRRYVDAGLLDAVIVRNGSRRTIRVQRAVAVQFVKTHRTNGMSSH